MGAIIYTLIRHGLIEMKANPYFMNVYIGVLILLTIAIDRVRELYGEKK
jgi:ribose/xylose/arabinose/galactoside ABC-type transport system permease subunit